MSRRAMEACMACEAGSTMNSVLKSPMIILSSSGAAITSVNKSARNWFIQSEGRSWMRFIRQRPWHAISSSLGDSRGCLVRGCGEAISTPAEARPLVW
eukprot:1588450-Amphidinium_carterae.2